jgi:hypothetical protein
MRRIGPVTCGEPDGRAYRGRTSFLAQTVVNSSRDYIMAVVPVEIRYNTDVRAVFDILRQAGERVAAEHPDVLAETEIDGITHLGASSMTVRTSTRVKPGCHEAVAAALRLAMKEAFDRHAGSLKRDALIPEIRQDVERERQRSPEEAFRAAGTDPCSLSPGIARLRIRPRRDGHRGRVEAVSGPRPSAEPASHLDVRGGPTACGFGEGVPSAYRGRAAGGMTRAGRGERAMCRATAGGAARRPTRRRREGKGPKASGTELPSGLGNPLEVGRVSSGKSGACPAQDTEGREEVPMVRTRKTRGSLAGIWLAGALLAALAVSAPAPAFAAGGGGNGGGGSEAAPGRPADLDYTAGVKAIKSRDYPRAVSHLEKVVARDDQNADAYNWLAYAIRKNGDPAKSIPIYEKALAVDPKHRGAHEYIGEAYLALDNLPKAKEHLARLNAICFFPCSEYRDLKKAVEAYESSGGRAKPTAGR